MTYICLVSGPINLIQSDCLVECTPQNRRQVKEDDDRRRKRAARNGAALKLLSVGMGGVADFRLTGAAIFFILILSKYHMVFGSDC
ncbi:unnamed protein product, partial [Notodromas monacha]